MSKSHHRWLAKELAAWEEESLITEEVSRLLQQRYGITSRSAEENASRTSVILSLFGGLLIGAGIITLFAFNWEQLDRGERGIIAFLPLLAAQALTLFVLRTGRKDSTAWREGSAAFFFMALAGSMGILFQTYQIGGTLRDFLLMWSLLSLPIVYWLRSLFGTFLYTITITAWCLLTTMVSTTLAYLLLQGLLLPLMLGFAFRKTALPRIIKHLFGILHGLSLLLFLGKLLTLQDAGEGEWTLAISLLSLSYLLLAQWVGPTAIPSYFRPFRRIGLAFLMGMAFFLTYQNSPAIDSLSELSSPLVLGTLALTGLLLSALLARQKRWLPLLGWTVPLLLFAGHPLLANLAIALIGTALIMKGSALGNSLAVNVGVFLLAVLAILRFFDADLPLLIKAAGFIGVGVAFLTFNGIRARRKAKPTFPPTSSPAKELS